MKAHRVLGGDEIEAPLRPALQRQRRRELLGARAALLRGDDRVEHRHVGVSRALEQLVRAVLDRADARLDLGLVVGMANLAQRVDDLTRRRRLVSWLVGLPGHGSTVSTPFTRNDEGSAAARVDSSVSPLASARRVVSGSSGAAVNRA